MILFHHRALLTRNAEWGTRSEHQGQLGAPSAIPHSALCIGKWLPGMDSHHHKRLQRALSCY